MRRHDCTLLRAGESVGRCLADPTVSQLAHEAHTERVHVVVERMGRPSLELGGELGAKFPGVLAGSGGPDQGLYFGPHPREVLIQLVQCDSSAFAEVRPDQRQVWY